MATIYVINPNSTQAVTDAIDEALDPLRAIDGPEIECVTLADGPPGIDALREQSARPVFGISECGVLTALSIAPRFGVLAILPGSIPRHQRYFAAMGVTDRLAGEIAIDVGVVDLADEQRTFGRLTECGR